MLVQVYDLQHSGLLLLKTGLSVARRCETVLIHETDLRGKFRPKHEVRNYRRKVAIHESGQREVAT